MKKTLTINKAKLAMDLHKKIGFSHILCQEIISHFFNEIVFLTKRDSKLTLHNFGNWKIHKKNKRAAFDIKNKNIISLDSRFVLRFTPSEEFKKNLLK